MALPLIANIINLGADLGAMGAALDLLIGGPGQLYTLLFGVVCIVLEVWLSYPRDAVKLSGRRFRCSLMSPLYLWPMYRGDLRRSPYSFPASS